MKKFIIITLCVLTIISCVLFLVLKFLYKDNVESFTYNDGGIPSTIYKINISRKHKTVTAEFEHTCSAKDCPSIINKCDIKLTDDEYNKIMRILGKKDIISPVIEDICNNDKVFYESLEDSYEDSTTFNKMDTNKDGKVTYREFGNYRLSTQNIN